MKKVEIEFLVSDYTAFLSELVKMDKTGIQDYSILSTENVKEGDKADKPTPAPAPVPARNVLGRSAA